MPCIGHVLETFILEGHEEDLGEGGERSLKQTLLQEAVARRPMTSWA